MMPWSHWNQADKTLLFAFVLFLFGLCIKSAYPASVFSNGFLFVAEAALVGGAADWFAVTALFRKPFGFPYHTAILPRRRRDFVEAAVKLVQREFFTSRRLITMVDSYDWKALFLSLAEENDFKRRSGDFIHKKIIELLDEVDLSKYSKDISNALRHELSSVSVPVVISWLGNYLKDEGRDQRILSRGAKWLRIKVESDEAKALFHDAINDMVQKKAEGAGLLGMLFASLAKASNIINVDELTEIIQQEAERFLDEASEQGSETSNKILEVFYRKLDDAAEDEGLINTLDTVRERLLKRLPIDDTVDTLFVILRQRTRDMLNDDGSEVSTLIRSVIDSEIEKVWNLLEGDEHVAALLDALARDMAGRSALKAQEIGGIVVREVMERLTDEQLNHIVYSKIEPDLLWIRMNGSVVGALIGCVLFMVMTAVK